MSTLSLIASSPKFRALPTEVEMVAPVDSAVLIQGETGIGKEVIARATHEGSPRGNNRFVALNRAAIPVYKMRKLGIESRRSLGERPIRHTELLWDQKVIAARSV